MPLNANDLFQATATPAPAQNDNASLAGKISGAESGGNAAADAQLQKYLSSNGQEGATASGLGQFIDPTWANVVAKTGAKYPSTANLVDLANQYQTDTRPTLAKRQDPTYQNLLNAKLDAQAGADMLNEQIGLEKNQLANAGIQNPTDTDVYSVHFTGNPRAAAINRSAPDTPLQDVFDSNVVAKNPGFFKGAKTVGDVFNNLSSTLNRGSSGGSSGAPGIPDNSALIAQSMQIADQMRDRYLANKPQHDNTLYQDNTVGMSQSDIDSSGSRALHPYTSALKEGFNRGIVQSEGLGGGALGFIGDVVGNQAMKDWGIGLYNQKMDEAQQYSHNASFTDVWEGKSDVVPYLLDNLTYVGYQALEGAATGGVGAFLTKQVGKQAVKSTLKGMITSELGNMTDKYVAEQVAKGMTQDAALASLTDAAKTQMGEVAVTNVVNRMANAGRAVGVFANNARQETGTIYGDAAKDGKTDGRLGDIFAWAMGASLVDTIPEYLMQNQALGVLGKGSHEGFTGNYPTRVLKAAGQDSAMQGGTEFAQTLMEQKGADQEIGTPDSIRDIVDSTASGALGGASFGPAAGIHKAEAKQPNSPLSNAVIAAKQAGGPQATAAPQADAQATAPVDQTAAPASPTATAAPADQFAARLAAVDSRLNDTMQTMRKTEGYGEEGAKELVRAFALARNPNVDPGLRDRVLTQLEGQIKAVDNRTNFTMPQNAAEAPAAPTAPGTSVVPAPSRTVSAQANPDLSRMGNIMDGQVREVPDAAQQIAAPQNPQIASPKKNALSAPVPMHSEQDQQYADLQKIDQIDQNRAALQRQAVAMQRFNQELKDTDQRTTDATQKQINQFRYGVLQNVLGDKNALHATPQALSDAYQQTMRNIGVTDFTPTDNDNAMIQRFVDVRDAKVDTDPAAPNELDASAAGIPEATTPESTSPSDMARPGILRTAAREGNRIKGNVLMDRNGRKIATLRPSELKALIAVQPDEVSTEREQAQPANNQVSDATPAGLDYAEWRKATGKDEAMPAPGTPEQQAELSAYQDYQRATVIPQVTSDVDAAAHKAATSPLNAKDQPSDAEKESGEYEKGRVEFTGLRLAVDIEYPAGSVREGTDANGQKWRNVLRDHYGEILGTEGNDGDRLDAFIVPGLPSDWKGHVFVINQKNEDGSFDEHKAVIGAKSAEDAAAIYRRNYAPGWDGIMSIADFPPMRFKAWAKNGDMTKPAGTVAEVKATESPKPADTKPVTPDIQDMSRKDFAEAKAQAYLAQHPDAPKGVSDGIYAAAVAQWNRFHAEDQTSNIRFSLRDTPIVRKNQLTGMFSALGKFDEAYQRPTSESKKVEQITKDIDPGYKATQMNKGFANLKSKGKTQTAWIIHVPRSESREAYLYDDGRRVWIDVSKLQPGIDAGNVVYNIAAAYAHNNDRVFIGDPVDLSPMGFYRRLENMISSALKYGTTKHLYPHAAQVDPVGYYGNHPDATMRDFANETRGLGLDWQEGDDGHNLAQMLMASYNAAVRAVPEIKYIVYDPDSRQFIDTRTGERFSRSDFAKLSARLRAEPGSRYLGGSSTLARAAITNSLVSAASPEQRRSLLASVGDQLRGGQLDFELNRLLYSLNKRPEQHSLRNENYGAVTMQDLKAVTAPIIDKLRGRSVVLLETPDKLPKTILDDIARRGISPWQIEGVFHDGTIYLIADSISTPDRAVQVLLHEGTHFGLRGMFGRGLDPIMMDIGRKNEEAMKYARDYASRLTTDDHVVPLVVGVEEYLTHLSETQREKLNGWDRLVARVRQMLRNWGLVQEWTDKDISMLIHQALDFWQSGKRFNDWTQAALFNANSAQNGRLTFPSHEAAEASLPPAQSRQTENLPQSDRVGLGKTEHFDVSRPEGGKQTQVTIKKSRRVLPEDIQLPDGTTANYATRQGTPNGPDGSREESSPGTDNNSTNSGQEESPDDGPRFSLRSDAIDWNDHAREVDPQTFEAQISSPRNWMGRLMDFVGGSETFNALDKTIHTQFHKAQKNANFRRVMEALSSKMNAANTATLAASEKAPDILPKIDTAHGIKESLIGMIKGMDNVAGAEEAFKAVMRGTLSDRLYLTAEEAELTPAQFLLYQQYRAAIDESLTRMGVAEAYRAASILVGKDTALRDQLEQHPENAREVLESVLAEALRKPEAERLSAVRTMTDDIPWTREYDGTPGREWSRLRDRLEKEQRENQTPEGEANYQQALVDKAIRISKEVENIRDRIDAVRKIFERVNQLQNQGYAPLSRFGEQYLDIYRMSPDGQIETDEKGEPKREFFGLYESKNERDMAMREVGESLFRVGDVVVQLNANDSEEVRKAKIEAARKAHPEDSLLVIDSGTKSADAYKLYRGVNPETVALFAKSAGLDESEAYQEWIRKAVANKSAMKRLIQRKKVPGFATDGPRVLANFLTSNGRRISQLMHDGEIADSLSEDAWPKHMGAERDEAIKLNEYVDDPREEVAGPRALLFAHFLGGSVSNFVINATQPAMVTLPYLAQYVGTAKSTKLIGKAYKMSRQNGNLPVEIQEALKRADQAGVVGANEVFHLFRETSRPLIAKMGDSILGKAIGKTFGQHGIEQAQFRFNAFMQLWASPFALAETINRKVSFISGYMAGQELGKTPEECYEMGINTVQATQFIYGKHNRPNWARGSIGAMLFTFKMFSISYVEALVRMARNGPQGRRAALVGLTLLVFAAGANGLPGSDDLDDGIDTLMQLLGYNWNTKDKKRRGLESLVGETATNLFLNGPLSVMTGMDVSGRFGLGNLIPATGIFKPSGKDKAQNALAELAGPTGSLLMSYVDAADAAQLGNYRAAARAMFPKALRDAMQGAEMAITGEYRDTKGRKVMDVGPGDALAKSLGFQPYDVGAEGKLVQPTQERVAYAARVKSELTQEWAQAIRDGKPNAYATIKEKLDAWNDKNPETPIDIKTSSVLQRKRQMEEDRKGRVVKAAPRGLKDDVRDAVNAD